MNSLDKYVSQVAETIDNNHDRENSEASFIFGISGKWGEGKTDFLNRLEPKLIEKGFLIVRVNPWKFANDRISFLRSFLKQLNSKTEKKKSKFDRLRLILDDKNDKFRNLDKDVTDAHIHLGYLLLILLFFIFSLLVIFLFHHNWNATPVKFQELILEQKPALDLLIKAGLLTISITILSKIIIAQRSSKSISTLDKFDELLDQILKDNASKKICIFVDDLDRVTPEMARNVLDNLRTFFDNPKLTFIVTGDHTVLERYIGEQTLPNKQSSEQLEEGRRFLKKIFDVYWKLPRPILKDFKSILEDLYSQRAIDLDTIFKTPQHKEILLQNLTNYFDKNYREVIRFLDKTIFTFKIINIQLSSASKETKKYYEEMLNKPLLVVRILMFEELCFPFFDELLKDSQLLKDMEKAVASNNDGALENLINSFLQPDANTHKKLSPSQEIFLRRFIKDEPRFYRGRSWDVYSITPYLSLAADSGMGDEHGATPEDFIAELKLGDSEVTKSTIENSGEKLLADDALAAFNFIQNSNEPIEKATHLTTILTALRNLPNDLNQEPFLENFKSIDLSIYNTSDSATRLKIYDLFWKWLDTQNNIPEEFESKFTFQSNADLDYLNSASGGKYTSQIITRWIWTYHQAGNSDSFERMRNILPNLDSDTVKQELNTQVDSIINSLLSPSDEARREDKYYILINFTSDGSVKLKEEIFRRISIMDETAWDWIISKADSNDESNKNIWTRKELTQEIHNLLQTTSDIWAGLNYAKNKIQNDSVELWDILLNAQVDAFINSLPKIISDSSFSSLQPPLKYAKRLFSKVVDKIELLSVEEKLQWIPFLNKNVWLWNSLGEIQSKNKIKTLTESDNESIKTTTEATIKSWEPTN